jgi:hypothetical protein
VSGPTCGACGGEKTFTARCPHGFCSQCARERSRRRRTSNPGAAPTNCAGAGERLQRYIDSHWPQVISKLEELMRRRIDFKDAA